MAEEKKKKRTVRIELTCLSCGKKLKNQYADCECGKELNREDEEE